MLSDIKAKLQSVTLGWKVKAHFDYKVLASYCLSIFFFGLTVELLKSLAVAGIRLASNFVVTVTVQDFTTLRFD